MNRRRLRLIYDLVSLQRLVHGATELFAQLDFWVVHFIVAAKFVV